MVMSSCTDKTGEGPESAPTVPQVPETVWPTGAVLAVGDVIVLEDEIARVSEWVRFLQPENTLPSLRRQALTHIVLDRAALAGLYAERREEVQAEALEALKGLHSGDEQAADAQAVTGTWSDLGLGIWGETRDLEQGVWGGPFELVGRWVLLRQDAAFPGLVAAADQYTVSIVSFPYTPSAPRPTALESQGPELTIIDPAWEHLVPNAWGVKLPEHWYAGPK